MIEIWTQIVYWLVLECLGDILKAFIPSILEWRSREVGIISYLQLLFTVSEATEDRQPSAWASRWWLLCNVHCRYSCSTKNSLNIYKSPHWISSRRLRGLRWVSFFWMTKIFKNDSKFFMEKGVLQKKTKKMDCSEKGKMVIFTQTIYFTERMILSNKYFEKTEGTIFRTNDFPER